MLQLPIYVQLIMLSLLFQEQQSSLLPQKTAQVFCSISAQLSVLVNILAYERSLDTPFDNTSLAKIGHGLFVRWGPTCVHIQPKDFLSQTFLCPTEF